MDIEIQIDRLIYRNHFLSYNLSDLFGLFNAQVKDDLKAFNVLLE